MAGGPRPARLSGGGGGGGARARAWRGGERSCAWRRARDCPAGPPAPPPAMAAARPGAAPPPPPLLPLLLLLLLPGGRRALEGEYRPGVPAAPGPGYGYGYGYTRAHGCCVLRAGRAAGFVPLSVGAGAVGPPEERPCAVSGSIPFPVV